MDTIAVLTLGGNDTAAALHDLYAHPCLEVPPKVHNADRKVDKKVPI